jgi:NAD(P)-dependent dehydrogenase (short-subunit alcohol dehydrogenase family)
VDLLVSKAGLSRIQPLQDITAAQFDEMLAVNLRAPFLLAQAVVRPCGSGGRPDLVHLLGRRVHRGHRWPALRGAQGRALSDGVVVRSLVPISIRGADEHGMITNRVSAVLANLPVPEPDPVQRLGLIREQIDEVKRTHQAAGAGALTQILGLAPPPCSPWGRALPSSSLSPGCRR